MKICCCMFCRRELLVGENQNAAGTMYADHLCLEMVSAQMRKWEGIYPDLDNSSPPLTACAVILREPLPKKKFYVKPKLTVYGNIRDMTHATHMGTMSDHHHGMGGHKTA